MRMRNAVNGPSMTSRASLVARRAPHPAPPIATGASAFSVIGMPEEPKPLVGRDQTLHTAPLAARDFWNTPAGCHLKYFQQLLGNDVIALIACLVECDQDLVRDASLHAQRGRGRASFRGFVAQRSVLPSRTPGAARHSGAAGRGLTVPAIGGRPDQVLQTPGRT
jgi:hypothetical protein